MQKKFRCKIGLHKFEDVKTQRTINVAFGFAGCELPGWRVVQKCKYCGHIGYQNLTLFMPNRYLYQEEIWKD